MSRFTSQFGPVLRSGLVLVAACVLAGQAAAQESATPESPDADTTMIDSPAFKIGWPKIEMPKFSWKPGFGGGDEAAPGAPKENPVSKTLDKVADASKRAADGVRGAWGSAMSKLPFGGGDDTSRQTAGAPKQSWWSKLMTPIEEEPQGSQTVQEFLAQDRPGTTRR